jgi:Protein of unknown function (DUF1286)
VKELTHYTFSVGASLYALSVLGHLSWYSIVAALWLSLSVNFVIDALGHSMSGNRSRTRLTHSIFTAPVWGAAVSLISAYVFSQALLPNPRLTTLEFWTAAGILIALGHLFLDSVTEGGVYRWRKRIALAHFRYDNLALNAIFILTGLGLASLAILQSTIPSQVPPISLFSVENFVASA